MKALTGNTIRRGVTFAAAGLSATALAACGTEVITKTKTVYKSPPKPKVSHRPTPEQQTRIDKAAWAGAAHYATEVLRHANKINMGQLFYGSGSATVSRNYDGQGDTKLDVEFGGTYQNVETDFELTAVYPDGDPSKLTSLRIDENDTVYSLNSAGQIDRDAHGNREINNGATGTTTFDYRRMPNGHWTVSEVTKAVDPLGNFSEHGLSVGSIHSIDGDINSLLHGTVLNFKP